MRARRWLAVAWGLCATVVLAQAPPFTRPTQCNADPDLMPQIIAASYDEPSEALLAAIRTPAFLEAIGWPELSISRGGWGPLLNFTYPPLVDVDQMFDRIVVAYPWQRDGFFVGPNQRPACTAPPPADVVGVQLEYYDAQLDQFFYTGQRDEIAALDRGDKGGWRRTGMAFEAIAAPACPFKNDAGVVYRFVGTPGKGPDSHFFTRDRRECALLDRGGQWTYEGVGFWAASYAGPFACRLVPEGQRLRTPLYRAWRPFGTSTHRFSTHREAIDEVVARGWIDEGPVMCVLHPSYVQQP